ncbi:ferrous iron transporter FeoB [Thiovulum sp. ES]|nr:ferrous iron transporter FeoB [Thiovulum sp. ES]
MIKIAVVGQPNVGKSSLINSISDSNLKVGNFAGVTVEKKEVFAKFRGIEINFIDLPGSYSLQNYTLDEKVTSDFLQNEEYDLIVNVADSTQLEKSLFLTTQLLELNLKVVLALNMIDEAEEKNIVIDSENLSTLIGIPVVKISAKKKIGIDELLEQIVNLHIDKKTSENRLVYSQVIEEEILNLEYFLNTRDFQFQNLSNRANALKLLQNSSDIYEKLHEDILWVELSPLLKESLEHIHIHYEEKNMDSIFSEERVAISKGIVEESVDIRKKKLESRTEKVDSILLHKFFGIPIFLFLMWGLFQLTFEIGSIPMDWIDGFISFIGSYIGGYISHPLWNSLIVDGVIGGVGAVLLFLPNILILFLGIAILETTGYMSRVAFLLDGFFHKFGLHGKSFIPLVTGFGCSIPAYMSARTLKSEKDRLLTMFIIGFMSCGAKLPVYVLFVSAFFPTESAGNWLFAIYMSGAIFGLIGAKILRVFVFKGKDEPFVMELPTYRMPSLYLLWHTVYTQAIMYLKKAGTFILFASILIWFASSFPKVEISEDFSPEESKQIELENSYLGQVGKLSEPIFEPLGFDWKMAVALETGVAAKEVIVATLGVLYSIGDEVDEESETLIELLRENIPLASAVAFIIFVMIYIPCFAASIVFVKESGKKIYFLYLIAFTTISAYVLSFIGYTIAKIIT